MAQGRIAVFRQPPDQCPETQEHFVGLLLQDQCHDATATGRLFWCVRRSSLIVPWMVCLPVRCHTTACSDRKGSKHSIHRLGIIQLLQRASCASTTPALLFHVRITSSEISESCHSLHQVQALVRGYDVTPLTRLQNIAHLLKIAPWTIQGTMLSHHRNRKSIARASQEHRGAIRLLEVLAHRSPSLVGGQSATLPIPSAVPAELGTKPRSHEN